MVKVVKKKVIRRTQQLTKAQQHKKLWLPENVRRSASMVLQATLAEARLVYKDDSIATAGEVGGMVLGIPLPSFALEYCLQNTVWPLERVTQVVGIQGTSKSGFTYEVGKWFRKANGIATIFEHESKYSPDWAMSHVGWDDPDAFGVIPCKSVDDWQAKVGWMIDKCKRAMTGTKKEPGSGRIWPWLGIVDSIMGKAAAETQKNIQTKGSAGRARPLEALIITQYLRALPESMSGWPFSFLTVNHLKPDKDPYTQAIIRNKSGGRGLDFMETWELELSSQMNKRIRTANTDGTRLFLACKKNSLGITDRKIPVDVTWWQEEVYDAQIGDTAWRQITEWDWFAASIRLLLTLPKVEEAKAKLLAEIINVVPLKGGKVACKALGISKASPLSYKEAGMVLQETPEVLDALRKLYGVKLREAFVNNVDYRKQRRVEKKRLLQRITTKNKKFVDLSKTVPAKFKPSEKQVSRGKLIEEEIEIELPEVEIEEEEEIEVES